MDSEVIYRKALEREFLSREEGHWLYQQAPTNELIYIANKLRKDNLPGAGAEIV